MKLQRNQLAIFFTLLLLNVLSSFAEDVTSCRDHSLLQLRSPLVISAKSPTQSSNATTLDAPKISPFASALNQTSHQSLSTYVTVALVLIFLFGVSSTRELRTETESWTGMRAVLAWLMFTERMYSTMRPSCTAFIVLAGAILTNRGASRVERPEDYVSYLLRRLVRVLPALWVAQAFRVSQTMGTDPQFFDNLLSTLMTTPSFLFDLEAWDITGHDAVWFILAIEFLYILCPMLDSLVTSTGSRQSASRCLALATVCLFFKLAQEAYVISRTGMEPAQLMALLTHPTAFLPDFILGILVSHALDASRGSDSPKGAYFLAFLGILTDVAVICVMVGLSLTWIFPTLLPVSFLIPLPTVNLSSPIFALILFSLGHPRILSFTKSLLTMPALLQMGNVSFGTYLYGFFLQKRNDCIATSAATCGIAVLASLYVQVLLLAFFSFYLVEEPSQKLLRWLLTPKHLPDAHERLDTSGSERWNMTWEQWKARALHKVDSPKNPNFFFYRSYDEDVVLCSSTWFMLIFLLAFLSLVEIRSVIGGQLLTLQTVIETQASLQRAALLTVCWSCFHAFKNYLAPWPGSGLAEMHKNDPSYLAKIGCIIPCHQSADEVVESVQSLLKYLKPEHIIVVDNGNSQKPLDDTQARLKNLNPDVVYMWLPLGLKSNALWMGLQRLPEACKFVMHIDDDTVLPDNFVFDETVWENEATSAISYGISMKPTGVVERLVDFEFKLFSQERLFESTFSTVWFQHGIIGIWRREAFKETMQEHPFLPFGEDNWNGIINLLKNRQMRQELRSHVITYAPSALLPGLGCRTQGYGAANLWKQRADRWCVNAPRRFFIRLYLFFSYRHDTILGNIVFRLQTIFHLAGILFHLLLPPCGLYYFLFCRSSWMVLILSLAPISGCVHALLHNYVFWRHRADIQVDIITVLLYPFYQLFLLVCTCYGHWRCLLWYIPFQPPRYALYTEDLLTPELLKKIHNIDLRSQLATTSTEHQHPVIPA